MPNTETTTSVFQALIYEAVAKGVAPGFQCVVFTRDAELYNGVSGLASLPSPEYPAGRPYTCSTLLWTASCTKLLISLLVLHILERGLSKTGISLGDLDNHDALVEVLPEFRHDSGSLVNKIIEGFEDKLGPDGKKVMKLRDVKGKVTLRMLLTHTAGMAFAWNHHILSQLYKPSDGSLPNNKMPLGSGNILDFEVPLVFEPGTNYHYGSATDWLGQFAIRATGRTLRQLLKDIIFEPLGIPPTEADIWLSPQLQQSRADIHVRDATSSQNFRKIEISIYSAEHNPAQGKAVIAEAGVFASMQSYARILQAVLNEDHRLLRSKEVWSMAKRDDLEARGLKIPRPDWKTAMPDLTPDVDQFSKSTIEGGVSINLLQCKVATAQTLSGRPVGSFAWGGLTNVYYFIDPITGVGAVIGTQMLPFYDSRVVETRDKLETLVYKTLAAAV
ncbi:beta-lactamase/transpeptidase-like protein [Ramaria rubella]|nr:beta-lactamase/transpeptidase-like protein [Ramaria rubella]